MLILCMCAGIFCASQSFLDLGCSGGWIVLEDALRGHISFQKFDVITTWEVLGHIAERNLPQLFENIKRHLASDGYLVGLIVASIPASGKGGRKKG